ncbi:MAG: hypothetical protein LBO74_04155 [Candidatus Symbiothrix sp.]|jgi:hypothetical protein|nr:hypothetical protein [Candidatus Symbiothrix sp.]
MSTEETKKKKKNLLKQLFIGEILKEEFVTKQSQLLVLIVILIILFISNGYSCMKKLSQIEDLKNQLKDVKYENLIISTQLTSNSCQSQIEDLLERKGIALSTSKTPAFEIYK